MSEPAIPFYVVGALLTVYIVAATWRSKDAEEMRAPTIDRRIVHWWRAQRRVSAPED